MGLLDDAIREHLDLKRRHGASDDEIAQKEAEALGPARREFPRAAEEDVAVEDVPAHVEDDGDAHPFADPLEEEIAEPPVFDPPAEPETSAVDPSPAPRAELADTEEYRFEDDDDPEEDDDAYGDDDEDIDLDDDDLDLDDDEDDEDDEDLLGDTPDFLQDTPEHDRLWFEQKPPRDFDFE